jgi:hypothetical protein
MDNFVHQREIFAEEEVKCAFPRLVSFVVQTEHAINQLARYFYIDFDIFDVYSDLYMKIFV